MDVQFHHLLRPNPIYCSVVKCIILKNILCLDYNIMQSVNKYTILTETDVQRVVLYTAKHSRYLSVYSIQNRFQFGF